MALLGLSIAGLEGLYVFSSREIHYNSALERRKHLAGVGRHYACGYNIEDRGRIYGGLSDHENTNPSSQPCNALAAKP
jgi:hypothetical protein